MKLYVTRHGRTQWNEENRICGITDIPLAEKGIEQAQSLARETEGKGIDRIICSPLMRAVQTAQIVSQVCGAPVAADRRLAEQNYGIYEGMQHSEPGFMANKRQFALPYPEGESQLQLAARVFALLEEIKRVHEHETVLLVSHGAVCRMIHAYFTPMTTDEFVGFVMPNCRLLEYEF